MQLTQCCFPYRLKQFVMENTNKDLHNEEDKLRILKNDNSDEFFLSESLRNNILIAQQTPTPSKLFGDLWFENELCILFGDTGCGKSILAMQLATNLASYNPGILGLEKTCSKKRVIYLDFELSPKQREMRLSGLVNDNNTELTDDIIIVELNNPIVPDSKTFEDFFIEMLEIQIQKWEAEVVFIDNLTYISNDLQKGNKALEIMKLLKGLIKRTKISLILLAHVPKRDETFPISKNDLSGSKNIANFADSIFAIGVCLHDQNTRYIKQIKERAVERKYGYDNILMCLINKEKGYLEFEFLRFDNEMNMLLNKKDAELLKRRMDAKQLFNEGKNLRDIGKLLGVSHVTVKKDLKAIEGNEYTF
jgi:RecA-family ATPase